MQKYGSGSKYESRLDSIREGVRNLVDAGGERASHFKDRAVDAKDSLFGNSEAAVDRVATLIKEHPFAALGIAFSAGYVAMRLMRR